MSTRDFTVLTDVSLITCVVQRGKANEVLQAAESAGAHGATIHYGYGSGVRERLGILGLAVDVEKEIITTMVAGDQLDRVFERMYFAGDLDVPGAGVIYVTKLDKAAMYISKEVLQRINSRSTSAVDEK